MTYTLWMSLRSPFARRVRLALEEMQVPYQESVVDVFKPTPAFLKANPLGRVPALETSSGEVLIDSNLILPFLADRHGGGLIPQEQAARLRCYQWMGLAVGMMEKTVEYFLMWQNSREHGLPIDQTLLTEFRAAREAFCAAVETRAAEFFQIGAPAYLAEGFSQADCDAGAALAYLTLRDSPEWQERFPNARRYLEGLQARPSFQKTQPPR